MPRAELARRGGAVRVRTIRLADGRTATVYIVRKPGPRGGRTVLGETHKRKAKR